jgi:VWFA-related protein
MMERAIVARILASVSAVLIAGLGFFSGAQEVPQPKLQYDVRVALKLVQVSVVDKSGKPVTDLGREDFELTDNGKPVVFDHFEKRVFGAQPGLAEASGPASGINRKFFLLFDLGLTRARGISLARQTALRFLNEVVQPGDELAMVTYSTFRGMRVHEYLTTDIERIRKSITGDALGRGPDAIVGRAESLAKYWVAQQNLSTAVVTGKVAQDTQDYEYNAMLGDLSAATKDTKTDILNQSVSFCEQLRTLARSMKYVPGNKNVVLFSDGIPRALLYGRMASAPTGTPDSGSLSGSDASVAPQRAFMGVYEGMMKEFKTANCPIFTVDTSQRQSGSDVEDLYGTSEDVTHAGRDIVGSGTLREISDETGGRYLGSASSPEKAFETVRNLMGAIYVLGYPVKDTWDGKYHKLKVKVRRKKCEVVAQAGYYNPKPFSEYSTDDKLFQLMDLALSDNPQFLSTDGDLPFAVFPVWGHGLSLAAGIARIPGEKLAEGQGKAAETFLLILNDKNDIQSIVTFDFAGKAPAKGALDARFVLPTKRGQYNFRLVVRNRTTGWGARGNASLTVPAAPASISWVDPPLLFIPAANIVTAEATPKMPLSDLYPCETPGYFPALGAVPAGTFSLRAVIRCSGTLAETNLRVTGTLAAEGSRPETEMPVTLLNQARKEGTQTVTVEFPVDKLAPGTHTLVFGIEEDGGFLKGSASVTFKIE